MPYRANRVKQAILNQRVLQAVLVALPASTITATDSRPRPINSRTTAAEQQIIVILILLHRRTASTEHTSRGAFDRQNNRAVIRRGKDMSTKPIRVFFPAKWIRLKSNGQVTKSRRRKAEARTVFQPPPRSYQY